MGDLVRNLILIGLLLGLIAVYYIYRRNKKPLSDKHIRKGNDFVKEKEYDKAIQSYKKAIDIGKYGKGSKSSALDNICLCYLEQKDYRNSERYALEAMSISSTDYVAKLLYGKILYNTARFDDAIVHYKSFIDNKPTAPMAYSMLALCYASTGKAYEANLAVNNADKNKYEEIAELRKQIKQMLAKKKLSEKESTKCDKESLDTPIN